VSDCVPLWPSLLPAAADFGAVEGAEGATPLAEVVAVAHIPVAAAAVGVGVGVDILAEAVAVVVAVVVADTPQAAAVAEEADTQPVVAGAAEAVPPA
jgi:ribose 5-phosphate isomerase RpiB